MPCTASSREARMQRGRILFIMEEEKNSEVLIALLEERSVLWDKTSDLYKDKNLKLSAW
jgi:hypothetical protein